MNLRHISIVTIETYSRRTFLIGCPKNRQRRPDQSRVKSKKRQRHCHIEGRTLSDGGRSHPWNPHNVRFPQPLRSVEEEIAHRHAVVSATRIKYAKCDVINQVNIALLG